MKSYLKSLFSIVVLVIFGLLVIGSDSMIDEEYYTEDGTLVQIYENGQTASGKTDTEGRWHGVVTYQQYGKYYKCEYSHGERNGVCHYFNPDGVRIKSEIYVDGLLAYTSDSLRAKLIQSNHEALVAGAIHQQIETRQPWFNFWMSDFGALSGRVESFFNEIELYVGTEAPADPDEFYTVFKGALDSVEESGGYQDMLDEYDLLVSIELATAAKSQPLRLAILNRYRNGLLSSTYQILETEYPDYLSLLNQYGATTEDIKRVADAFDAHLDQLGPLDVNALEFPLQADEHISTAFSRMQEEKFDFGTVSSALLMDYTKLYQSVDPLYQGALRAYFGEDALDDELVALSAVYVAFFERAPDYAGLKYWADQAGSGAVDFDLMRRLTNGFAQHPSYTAIYGGLSDSAFVDAIYLNIGGAPADADGKAYWLARLSGGMTRPDFIAQFILDLLSYSEATLDQLVIQGIITPQERDNALLRKNRLTNKAVVGLAFANTLGSASNLGPGTDPNDPVSLAADPAYRASVEIIADVTEDMATRVAALAYLDTQPSIEDINNR